MNDSVEGAGENLGRRESLALRLYFKALSFLGLRVMLPSQFVK